MSDCIEKIEYLKVKRINDDSYVVRFLMTDGGKGLLDIDFINDDAVEIIEETYIESSESKEFVIMIRGMIGIVDWLEENSTDWENA